MVPNFLKITKLSDRHSADVIIKTREASNVSNEESGASFNPIFSNKLLVAIHFSRSLNFHSNFQFQQQQR